MRKKGFMKMFIGVGLAVVLAISIPIISGCTTQGPEPSPTPGPGPTGEPIKLGVPVPLTGYMASDGIDSRDGIILAVEEINAEGGINGRPVEVVTFDSKELLAETAAAAAEKLIVEEKVDGLVCCYFDEAGTDTFGQYDVPFLHAPGSHACINLIKDNGYTNVFIAAHLADVTGAHCVETAVNVAQAEGYEWPNSKIVTLNGPWEWGYDNAAGARDKAEELGWDVVDSIEVALETREWGGILSRIRPLDPALIFMEAWDAGCLATFSLQLQQNPMNTIIVHSQAALMPDYMSMMGENADGVLAGGRADAIPGPERDAFRAKFEDRFGRKPGLGVTANSYDMAMHWAEGVRIAGDPSDHDAVCEAIKNLPYEGLCGTYRYSDEYHVPSADDRPVTLYQARGGEWVPIGVYDEPIEGASFQTPPWIK